LCPGTENHEPSYYSVSLDIKDIKMSATLVVDNGAGILKAGLLTPGLDVTKPSLDAAPVRLPNCTAKSRAEKKFFVADGLDTAVELSALYIRRPHDRGYVVNWDLQGDVWQRMCHADVLGIKPGETSVLVSEPLFCPGEIKDNMAEFIFEEMGFQVRPLAWSPAAPPPFLRGCSRAPLDTPPCGVRGVLWW
jgi:actin-related protein